MSDDLIRRLCAAGWCRIDSAGMRWVDDAPMDAVRALAEKDAEIERLREALRQIAVEGVPRPVGEVWRKDGEPSKHDRCIHGNWMYEGCAECVETFADAALTLPPKA